MARTLARPLPFRPPAEALRGGVYLARRMAITSGSDPRVEPGELVRWRPGRAGGVRSRARHLELRGLAIYWLLDALGGWLARHSVRRPAGRPARLLFDRLLVKFFYLNCSCVIPDGGGGRSLPAAVLLIDLYLSTSSSMAALAELLPPGGPPHLAAELVAAAGRQQRPGHAAPRLHRMGVAVGFIAVALSAMKVYCRVRLQRLPSPEDAGQPARGDRRVAARSFALYAVCLASGLIPLVNAELYLAALSAAHGGPPLLLALDGTLGQMSSKSLVYLAGATCRMPTVAAGLVWPARRTRCAAGRRWSS
jgi:hypothetical protein